MTPFEPTLELFDKFIGLGGRLAPPVGPADVLRLEQRIGLPLPDGLRNLLGRHNGSLGPSDEGYWRFWSCDEIDTCAGSGGVRDFVPDNNDLRRLDPSVRGVVLPAANVILFADVLIEAAVYGWFHCPGHRFDGVIFDVTTGLVSAMCFEQWMAEFIARGEHSLIRAVGLERGDGGSR